MRKPHRVRNLELGLALLIAWPAFGIALLMPDTDPPSELQLALGILGLMGGVILTTLGLFTHGAARKLDRMRRGEGVLARWQIGAPRWHTFVDHCRQLAQVPGQVRNALELPAAPPPHTYEVVVSDNAIRIEGEFQPVQRHATVRTFGSVLEFYQYERVGRRVELQAFRLPFPAGAETEVERIVRHYDAARQHATRPIRKVYALLALLAFVLCFLLLGLLTGWR